MSHQEDAVVDACWQFFLIVCHHDHRLVVALAERLDDVLHQLLTQIQRQRTHSLLLALLVGVIFSPRSSRMVKSAWAASKHVYGDDSLSRHWSRSSFDVLICIAPRYCKLRNVPCQRD